MRETQVRAAVELLDGGSTVPFIARYRKEVTGGLDDAQLRPLEERLGYLRELDERRGAILESIRGQGKLDPALHAQLMLADTKARLEDIYLPYKPKRRTKAQIAREAGHEPRGRRADRRPEHRCRAASHRRTARRRRAPLDPGRTLRRRRRPGRRAARADVEPRPGHLDGARRAKKGRGASSPTTSSSAEPFRKLPSHRILALFRGEKEEMLTLHLDADIEEPAPGERTIYEGRIAAASASPTGPPG